jgi:flagellar motor switch protein FliN/FliY
MADQSPTQPDNAAPPTGQDAAAMADQALRSAEQAVSSLKPATPADPTAAAPAPAELPVFAPPSAPRRAEPIDLLGDVNLNVKIELGRTRMLVEDVLRLGEGSVVELDKLAGDPVDVYVNDRHVARGEVLVLNDNFCVRVNEIIRNSPVTGA